jgi:hypothetical protein
MDLRNALRLNNEGIMLLLENRDQEALVSFTESLTQVKRLFAASEEDDNTYGQTPMPMNAIIHHSTSVIPNLHDVSCFIYNSALVFSLLDSDCTPSDGGDLHVYTSVIILNIALAFHRRGLTGNSAFLLKAEKMYEMVGKVLGNSDVDQGTALLVKIAAINNLSQLRHDQGDYAFSQQGFRYLGSLINYAGEQLHCTKCEEHMLRGMLLNAFFVTAPDAAPAA